MIVGDLVRCHDANPPAGGTDPEGTALATVLERIHAFGLPAASGAPVGHGTRNEAIAFAAACELDLDKTTIAITEAAVA